MQIYCPNLDSVTQHIARKDSKLQEGTKKFILAFQKCLKDFKIGYVLEKKTVMQRIIITQTDQSLFSQSSRQTFRYQNPK